MPEMDLWGPLSLLCLRLVYPIDPQAVQSTGCVMRSIPPALFRAPSKGQPGLLTRLPSVVLDCCLKAARQRILL